MIYSIKGTLTHTEPNLAVVECSGVGYACRTTANTVSSLNGKTGKEVYLFTYLYIREDNIELFGFAENAELSAFKLLISVSGVGPKAALSVLSDLSPQGFALCVASGDSKLLTRSPGIGAKTAQRIILELKDKIDKQKSFSSDEYSGAFTAPASTGGIGGHIAEAVSALVVLGFTAGQAVKALEGLDPDTPTPEMIKVALKRL